VKKTSIAILIALLLVVIPVGTALAATTADVTVTATPSFVSISNSPSSYDFGAVTEDTDEDTGTSYFSVTNDSSVNITVTIQCTSTWDSGGGSDWTYGAPGADQAQLKASDGDGAYDVTVPTGSAATLHTTSTAGEDFTWELQLDAPTSFSFGDAQQSTVTISASAI
jgi:hypothetical protein